MLDVQGLELTAEEREVLRHPLVGGVILFSRNYDNPQQLTQLVKAIHDLREPRLLISVDHEGGRVQRFRDGFTVLPPLRGLGALYEKNKKKALQASEQHAWLMASELRATGLDFSFAPVLDLDFGRSEIIGDRAFHSDPEIVSDLANAYLLGLKDAGMPAIGKHFPGHGWVEADSHLAIPVDERSLDQIMEKDVIPYQRTIVNGLAGVMPAHVIYQQIDKRPAGFSSFWLEDVLRKRLNFQGVIFSDDLSMEGATVAGSYPERAMAALAAGCDMVLVCNKPEAAIEVIDNIKPEDNPVSHMRMARLHGRHHITAEELHNNLRWKEASEQMAKLSDQGSLDLEFA
jgi:beta-N-acetylhexosaminidase